MATGRMLKKNVSESRRLSQLKTDSARLLWTWIIPFLDSEGRFYASPSLIKGKIVPRLLTFTEKNIQKYIDDMVSVGLITLYDVDGEKLLEYRKFNEFQKIVKDREATPLPSPNQGQIIDNNSRPNHDKVKSISKPAVSNLIESNLIESKLSENPNHQPVDNSLKEKPALLEKQKQLQEIKPIYEKVKTLYPDFNIQLFFQNNIRLHPEALKHTLNTLIASHGKGIVIENPMAWCETIMKSENMNYNAADSEARCNDFKKGGMESIGHLLAGIKTFAEAH